MYLDALAEFAAMVDVEKVLCAKFAALAERSLPAEAVGLASERLLRVEDVAAIPELGALLRGDASAPARAGGRASR